MLVLVPLGYLSAQQYYLISNKSIATLGDVKGLKINAGVESQSYFNPLGASVTKLPTSEWYSSLEKGIIDSIFIAVDTLQSFKLAEVCKYCNLDINGPNSAKPALFMLEERLRELPADVQEILLKSVDFLGQAVPR